MQYVHNWGSEVYHHGNSQKDFFLQFQPLVLSTPKRLLFTINLCISSEALLCPSICYPLLLFSPFCVSALNPSGLYYLVENSTILFTTLISQKQHSWCFIMLISSKEPGVFVFFFSLQVNSSLLPHTEINKRFKHTHIQTKPKPNSFVFLTPGQENITF